MHRNNTPELRQNHPTFCNMAVWRWREGFEQWLSYTTRLGFYQRLLETSSGQGNTLPKGPNTSASGKKQLMVSIPTECEACIHFPPTNTLVLAHRANRGRQSCRFLSVFKGTYNCLPFCSGFAFTLWRKGPRVVLVARHSLLKAWGVHMSRQIAADKHLPLCPPALRCPSRVTASEWAFSRPFSEEMEALTSASNLILWSRRPGPQCGDRRAVLCPGTLPASGYFVHPSRRCHAKGVQNGAWSRAHKTVL